VTQIAAELFPFKEPRARASLRSPPAGWSEIHQAVQVLHQSERAYRPDHVCRKLAAPIPPPESPGGTYAEVTIAAIRRVARTCCSLHVCGESERVKVQN
jgi:hypothetical protein